MVQFNRRSITREDILRAIHEFDSRFVDSNDHLGWLDNPAYRYAVVHNRRAYPPKLILSWASDADRSRFNGGEQTNTVFRQLGFEVVPKGVATTLTAP